MTLADINKNEQAEIVGHLFSTTSACKSKLLALGLLKKTVVRVINVAPLGDPLEIEVRGYHLSLRKDEAKCIKVKKV